MAATIETILVNSCNKGDLELIKQLKKDRINLIKPSRKKDFDTLFDRCLFECRNSKYEYELINTLIDNNDIANNIIKEKHVISLLARGKYDILDLIISKGYMINMKSSISKYETIYDRLLRESLIYQRTDDLIYLIKIFNIKYINIKAVINIIASNESTMDYIDSKIKKSIPNYTSLFNMLLEHGLDMSDVIKILNHN